MKRGSERERKEGKKRGKKKLEVIIFQVRMSPHVLSQGIEVLIN